MSEKKQESLEHKRLVEALIDELKRQGFEITAAACEGYEPCPEVEKLFADIKAYNRRKDYVVFGVAASCDDLQNELTEEKFKLFSSRYMASGKAKGSAVPLCIAITIGCEKQLETCLEKLKIGQKKNIFLYAF